MIRKTVIINRAVPGSGKTTITSRIVTELKRNNLQVSIHSTDEYFMQGEKYIFDIKNLKKHHQENFASFQESVEAYIDVIICDNTNIAPWQTEEYTQFAREHNYQILILTLDPRELEKHVQSQLITNEKPDAHGVDEKILMRMIKEYYIFDDLLSTKTVIDPDKHMHYEWDEEKMKKILIGTAKYFDSDFIIRIFPDEYKDVQPIIGKKILKLLEV